MRITAYAPGCWPAGVDPSSESDNGHTTKASKGGKVGVFQVETLNVRTSLFKSSRSVANDTFLSLLLIIATHLIHS
jgi:hypothetical protein